MQSVAIILSIRYLLIPAIAIVGGLLIFFLGRRHVRKKYGKK